jgi:hypothetical protein
MNVTRQSHSTYAASSYFSFASSVKKQSYHAQTPRESSIAPSCRVRQMVVSAQLVSSERCHCGTNGKGGTESRTPGGRLIAMGARMFFHLRKGADVILDKVGVEVGEVNQVRDALVKSAQEMQREQDLEMSELQGWELQVVDTAGATVMTVRLSEIKT